MQQFSLTFEAQKYTVREVTAKLRRMLRTDFNNLYVVGEISGLKTAASGHLYFSLKEEDTVLPCAMFRNQARLLRVGLRDGMQVQARGSIDIYEQRGNYQLLVEHVEPLGAGALQQAFEELKKRLAAEGLFEAGRKRELPKYPRRIGIVTSPTGAVIQDMLHIFRRRSPGLAIRIYPALVQGAGSTEQVCEGIAYLNAEAWAELIIVARGGGSIEDLWTFNEEKVARAIAGSALPVVSAIGHETDFTIADFVADLRAPTPSAAAEMVAPAVETILERLAGVERTIYRGVKHRLTSAREQLLLRGVERARVLLNRRLNRMGQRVDEAEGRGEMALRRKVHALEGTARGLTLRLVARDHRKQLVAYRGRMEAAESRMREVVGDRWRVVEARQSRLTAQLEQLNPMAILGRGYALVRGEDGRLVREAAAVEDGARLRIRVAEGEFSATAGAGDSRTK